MRNFILAVLLGLGFSFSIQNKCFSQSSFTSDFPKLSQSYEVSKTPVDYIFVVDQSGTVRNYWDAIKSSASRLVTLVNEGDYVTLIGFKETVDNLIVARRITSNNRNAIIDEIRNLAEPRGGYTDLFESVDFTLEKGINRPNGNKLQIIFYFTDFKNDPPPTSRWRTTSTEELSRKRINYIDKTGKLINIFAFQLPLEVGAGRDFDQFSQIFDNKVKRIISDLNTLQEWFGRLSQEISREKLKLVLQNDLRSFLSIKDIKVTNDQIKIDLHNSLGFPVMVKQAELQSDNVGLRVNQALKDVVIPAKGNSIISISISKYLLSHGSILEKHFIIVNTHLTLHCSFSNLDSEFGKLNIPTEQNQTIVYDQLINVSAGIPYWIIGVVALILLVVIYLIYKTWIKSEWIFKKKGFKVTILLDGKLLNSSTQLLNSNKVPVEISQSIIKQTDLSIEEMKILSFIQFNLFVVPVKPKLFRRTPKRGTYIYVDSKGTFTLKKLVRGKITPVALSKSKRLLQHPVHLHKGISITGIFNTGMNQSKIEINFLNK